MAYEALFGLPPKPVPIHWTVAGRTYEFQIDPIGAIYKPIPGVYIFCRLAQNGMWDALYIGETDSFWRRLSDQLRSHHCWERVRAAGATHISTLHVPGNATPRLDVETLLRRHLNPPLNLQ